jgi:chromosomal replication initiation ATPase DnaA
MRRRRSFPRRRITSSLRPIFTRPGRKRDIAIYLLKRYSGLTNRQIGDMFGGISFSAVSKLVKRYSPRVAEDRKLGKKIEALLSNVKG